MRRNSKTQVPPTAADESALLDMEGAIAALVTTRPTFYRWLRAGRITGVKVGRQWRFRREDIDRFLRGEGPRLDLPADLKPLIQDLQARLGDRKSDPSGDQIALALGLMLRLALHLKASDLHLPVFAAAGALQLRVDGELQGIARYDARLQGLLVEQLKRMAGMDPALTTCTQDGKIVIGMDGKRIELRVTVLPTGHGECLVARIHDQAMVLPPFEALGFATREKEAVERALAAPSGMVFFTGATGSGKATALYACAQRAAVPTARQVLVEQYPVYALPEAVRVRVDAAKGMGYAPALRSVLRVDPDSIVIDEIRDREAMEAAAECALGGHLVLAALHAPDAIAALRRVADLCFEHTTALDEVKIIVAQRLVRRICTKCGAAAKPPMKLLRRAELVAAAGGVPWSSLEPSWRQGAGCEACHDTGFDGRMMLSEVLEVTLELCLALRRNADDAELRAIAIGQGFATLAADGVRKAAGGLTTLDELRRSLPELAAE